MSTKPKSKTPEFSADDWVSQGTNTNIEETEPDKEATARFTIDIPVSLHARIKSECALKRVKMRDEVLTLLENRFPLNQ